jgi:glycosyltransferase involved in cell wall biosynthesis
VTTKNRVKKYYGIDSEIISPFVNFDKFPEKKSSLGNYFLIITRLVSWKRVDIAIKAIKNMRISLKIVGEGPDKERLKGMANHNTELLGFVNENEKISLIKGCIAVINTQLEDFGIVPLEALANGKPVIAYGKGGVLETIEPGITGEFFYEQTPEALMEILEKFNPGKYNPEICIERAKRFSKEKFKKKIIEFINNVY